jgi:pimeloyl-ACP methyl ester carboxylesterase
MGNVLLVHGGWVDSSCWDPVASPLRDRGHRVVTVELHRGTLAADTNAVQEALDRLGDDVVVCGWSYGGMVITGLKSASVRHLVYLTAFMPDKDESLTSLNERHPAEIGTVVQFDDGGDLVLVGHEIDELVWADAPPHLAAAARVSLRPQARHTFIEAPPRVSWRNVPSTYVICRGDRFINPDLQRQLARRATHVVEWDTSHAPMLSRPDLVIDLLDELAR